MNCSEADKLGGGVLLLADGPLLLSVRILLLETEADKFPTGISDMARKLCVTGWTGAPGAPKGPRCYQTECAAVNSEVFSERNPTPSQKAT